MIATRTADREPTVSPEELAAAMRQGLEARRFFRKPAEAPLPPIPHFELPDGSLLPKLLDLGGVIGAPAPAHGGVKGRVVRLARKVVKKLMNPWLDRQTRFNHTTYDHLQVINIYLGHLAAKMDTQNEVARRLLAELAASRQATATAHARMSEFFREVYQLRQALAAAGGPSPDGLFPTAPPPIDPVHVVEGLFLHTRLAPPPGRALVVSPVGLHALDLASLGYQVVLAGATAEPLSHPDLRVSDDVAGLPYADGSFDWAVAFCGEGEHAHGTGLAGADVERTRRAVARAMAPGGRLVGSYLVTDAIPGADDLADLLAPFRILAVRYASRAGHGWSLSESPDPVAELVLYEATVG